MAYLRRIDKKLQHQADIAQFQHQIKASTQEVTRVCDATIAEAINVSQNLRMISSNAIVQGQMNIGVLIVAGLIVGIIGAYFITRTISQPIKVLVEMAATLPMAI